MTHRSHSPTTIYNGRVVLEHDVLEKGAVVLAGGRIAYIGPQDVIPGSVHLPGSTETVDLRGGETHDAGGGWIFPGFIDVHVHGGGGADTMDGAVEAIETIARTHARHGTTALLPTTMTAPHDQIMAAARAVRAAMGSSKGASWPGARVLGMHLEGPYINPKRAGAQDPKWTRRADLNELGAILSVLEDGFKLATIAPEVPGGAEALEYLHRAGVVVSIGHTDATMEEATEAFRAGAGHVTHTYNAMRELHHRDPGTVGAALLSEQALCEVIADGIHVHPDAIRLLWMMKGTSGVCLVTDAIEAADMPDGTYQLGGQPVVVKDGACRLENGSLAGSILTMERAVRFMVREVGVPPADAARMASLNAAAQLRISGRKGSLKVGKDADVVLLDTDFQVVKTWVEGKLVHSA